MTDLVRPTHLLDELARNGALRTTGLYLTNPDLTYDQLEAVGGLLGRMHQSLRFAIGDWLLLVEERFPAEFGQASEVLQISEDGRREYLRVSQQVPRSVRREELSWSHHRAVAALEPPEQQQHLDAAVAEGLSHHQLRDRLRPEPVQEVERCRTCGRPLA